MTRFRICPGHFAALYRLAFLSFIVCQPALPQERVDFDESLYDTLEYRCIGPFRGGRSAAVTGIPGDPMTYYFGGTGGGVWRTSDGGQTW